MIEIDEAALELPHPAPEGLPAILAEDTPRKLRRLITHPLSFPELHGTAKLPRREARRMTPRRPERRIAMYKLGCVWARRFDLVSGRIGTPRTDGYTMPDGTWQRYFNGIGQAWVDDEGQAQGLAAETGLSVTRLRRAIAEYVRAGWATFSQRIVEYVNAAGERAYYACRAVYTLTDLFWKAIGLPKKMAKERAKASERAGNRRRIYALALLTRHASTAARTFDDAANDRRVAGELELALMKAHPNWPAARIRNEARRRRRR